MVASLLRGPRLSVFLCIILATLWLSFVYCFFLPQAFPQLCPLLLERVECALRGVASSPLCRLLPVLQQVRQREEREHRWAFYGACSLRAFQLLPFLQGTQ